MFSGVIRKMNSEIGEDTATLADTKSSGFNLHIISKIFSSSQDKLLANFQQRIAYVYEALSRIWTAIKTEKESLEES